MPCPVHYSRAKQHNPTKAMDCDEGPQLCGEPVEQQEKELTIKELDASLKLEQAWNKNHVRWQKELLVNSRARRRSTSPRTLLHATCVNPRSTFVKKWSASATYPELQNGLKISHSGHRRAISEMAGSGVPDYDGSCIRQASTSSLRKSTQLWRGLTGDTGNDE